MSLHLITIQDAERLDRVVTQLGAIFNACGVGVTIEAHVDPHGAIDGIGLGYVVDAIDEVYEMLVDDAEEVCHESAAPTATPDRSA